MTRLTEEELAKALGANPDVKIVSGSTNSSVVNTHNSSANWQVEVKPNKLTPLVPKERDEQAAVIAWADSHPEAWVLYANVNGQYRPGQRPEPGMRPGIPDLFLPIPRGGAHGLFIELKRNNGKPSDVRDDQKFWIETLLNRGYWAAVCNGADEAIAEIECYLQGEK